MADFRKWLFAFAVVALVLGVGVPAQAQIPTPQQALQCVANAGVPPIVRAEGITELVGDLVLNCTGGTPTPAGQPIPASNIQIFLNTNVTSRLLSGAFTEALLMIDEPHSPANPTTQLLACGDATAPDNGGNGACTITGTGGGAGVSGPYNGTAGRPNVFQGRLAGANSLVWLGVPVDPPGSQTRTIRITNVRANANQLGLSSTLVPTQIVEYISVTGSSSLPINNPQQTVAFIQRGLVSSVRSALTFSQCLSANPDIAASATAALNVGAPQGGQQFVIRVDEGFASAWKVRNIAQIVNGGNPAAASFSPTFAGNFNQDVPGAIYNTESGFYVGGTEPSPNPPLSATTATGTGSVAAQTNDFPATRGLSVAGNADTGTRIAVNFAAVPTGAQVFVPGAINIVSQITGAVTGRAVLVGASSFNTQGLAPVTITPTPGTGTAASTSGAGSVVYEVIFEDPFTPERLNIPIAVAFVSNTGNNLPATGVQSTASVSFSPLSTVTTSDSSAPIPRFAAVQTPANTFSVTQCACNILFPFVTNQAGFDTGVAIANTSQDPFGTTPQAGTVTLNYYGGTTGGGAAPAAQTSASVPAGSELVFTLSSGGNLGIAATPGFQGYIIAQSKFQFCHAFAFISDLGAQRLAEGYLGIVLDQNISPTGGGFVNRTGSFGEVQAH